MAMDLPTVARALHILAAVLWAGGGMFLSFILGPSLRQAGPAAGPFLMVVMRRGGLSWFFMTMGGITILTGAYLFYAFDYHSAAFASGRAIMITLGAILAVLAYLHGATASLPNERRMRRLVASIPPGTPPTPEQGAELGRLGQRQGKHGAISVLLVLVALVLMLGSRLA